MSNPSTDGARGAMADDAAIAARLDRMEREIARWKRIGACLLLAVAGASVMAQTTPPATTTVQRGVVTVAPVTKEIQAERFVLVDGSRKARAILEMTAEGPELSLLDAAGLERATLGLREKGPHLSLKDAARKTRAMLDLKGDGPSLVLADEGQVRQTKLTVGASRMGLALTTGGSRDVPLIELVERTGGGAREINRYHELKIYDPDGKGRNQAFLIVAPDGSADFGLRNSAGLAVFRKP